MKMSKMSNKTMNENNELEPFLNNVILGDVLDVMKKIPSGVVDMAFADPPFNLKKDYGNYDDSKQDEEYLQWCFKWINEMIRQSKIGGADYAKIQLYTSQLIWGDDSRKGNEFTFEQVCRIKDLCQTHQICFLATVNDAEKLEWCEKLGQQEYKVSSLILKRNLEFVREVVQTGKIVYIPLGMWEKEELPFDDENVRYLYCVSKYPTYWDEMKNFPKSFDGKLYYGYSDHTHGLGACFLAISRGAQIVEKHFTLNKAAEGSDHIGSMNFEELKILSAYGRELSNAYCSIQS